MGRNVIVKLDAVVSDELPEHGDEGRSMRLERLKDARLELGLRHEPQTTNQEPAT